MGAKLKAIFVFLFLSAVFLHSKTPIQAEGITTCQVSVNPSPYTYGSGQKRFVYSDSGDISSLTPEDQALITNGQLPLLNPSSTIQVSITTALSAAALGSNGPFTIVLEGSNITLQQGQYTLTGNTFTFTTTALGLVNAKAGEISAIIKGASPTSTEICRRSDVTGIFQVVDIVSQSTIPPPICSLATFTPALSTLSSTSTSVVVTLPASAINPLDKSLYNIEFVGKDINNANVDEVGPIPNFGSDVTITTANIAKKAYNAGSFLLVRNNPNGSVQTACVLASFKTNTTTGGVDPVDQGNGTTDPRYDLCTQTAAEDVVECRKCIDQVPPAIWTAFGCIPTSKEGIVVSFIRIGLGISGGFVLLSILYGAFLITTSSGDPKRVQEGQEMVTSAVMGLLFVIFSIIILRFIGVSLLQIPGFGT